MSDYFLDSSALLKRYMTEPGTAWVRGLFQSGTYEFTIASITGVELAAAVARRARGGGVSAADAARIMTMIRSDLRSDFEHILIDGTLIDLAMDLTQRHSLRGYDAVQLSAALAVRYVASTIGTQLIFVSSDRELNAAAAAEGLSVEDPNQHP